MAVRLQFSLKYFLTELLMLAMALGLTTALLTGVPGWFRSPGQTSILEVMAILLGLFSAAGFWGAALGGLFGQMKIGGRIAAYACLACLGLVTLYVSGMYLAIARLSQ
jgi:hypothetical protein